MAAERLTFDQRKLILKWHRKFDDVCEARGQWMCVVSTETQTRITIGRIRDKFEVKVLCKMHTRNDLGRPTTHSCLCCYGVTGIRTITKLSVRRCAAKPVHTLFDIVHSIIYRMQRLPDVKGEHFWHFKFSMCYKPFLLCASGIDLQWAEKVTL